MVSVARSRYARALAVFMLFATLGTVLAPTGAFAQNNPAGGLTVPITGTVQETGAVFTGTFTITRFIVDGATTQLLAVGTLVGTLTNPVTGVVTTVVRVITLPVNLLQSSGTCEILHLVIEGITLELLGLHVTLSRVVLDITAVAGAGNLLGNLLCAIAGLLDPPGPLTQLANLLNQLLRLLG